MRSWRAPSRGAAKARTFGRVTNQPAARMGGRFFCRHALRAFANYAPQQRLNFLPLPQGHASFRPTFGSRRTMVPGLTADREGT